VLGLGIAIFLHLTIVSVRTSDNSHIVSKSEDTVLLQDRAMIYLIIPEQRHELLVKVNSGYCHPLTMQLRRQ